MFSARFSDGRNSIPLTALCRGEQRVGLTFVLYFYHSNLTHLCGIETYFCEIRAYVN